MFSVWFDAARSIAFVCLGETFDEFDSDEPDDSFVFLVFLFDIILLINYRHKNTETAAGE